MARLLFIPMSWGRGIGPLMDCLSVAREVQGEGHIVAFVCKEAFRDLATRAGYKVYPNVQPPCPRSIDADLFNMDFPVFQGLGDDRRVREMVECELRAIGEFRPDVVFAWLQFTANISAPFSQVPVASVARWTGHPDFTSELIPGGRFPRSGCTPLFNQILRESGLQEVSDIWELDFVRSDLKVATGTPELERDLQDVPNLHYVGYLRSRDPDADQFADQVAKWATDHPIIYAFFSMKQFHPEQYIPVLSESFDGSEFRVIVSTGPNYSSLELPDRTENLWVVTWISPIDPVLSMSHLVISTATRGTAWQAALYGAAQLVFPGKDPERDFIAKMIETVGAGVKLSDAEFTPKRLLAAARDVLASDARDRSKAFGERLKQLGGPQEAARLLVSLAETRR